MRVISGKYKGRRLFSPANSCTRPTTDMVKESIFNILSSKNGFVGCALDLFCGSGALGIEALSRGVEGCVFVDVSPVSVSLAKKNLEHICASEGSFEVYCADYQLALKKLIGRQFSLVFLDAPFGKDFGQRAIKKLVDFDLVSQNGIIVYEHSAKNDLQISLDGYIIDERTFGSICVSFIQRSGL